MSTGNKRDTIRWFMKEALKALHDGNIQVALLRFNDGLTAIQSKRKNGRTLQNETMRDFNATKLLFDRLTDGWVAFERNQEECVMYFDQGLQAIPDLRKQCSQDLFVDLEELLSSSKTLSMAVFQCKNAAITDRECDIIRVVDQALVGLGKHDSILQNPVLKAMRSFLHHQKSLVLKKTGHMIDAVKEMDNSMRVRDYHVSILLERNMCALDFTDWLKIPENVTSHKAELLKYFECVKKRAMQLFSKEKFHPAFLECCYALIVAESLRVREDPYFSHELMRCLYIRRGFSALHTDNLVLLGLAESDSASALKYDGHEDTDALFLNAEVKRLLGKRREALNYAQIALDLMPEDIKLREYVDELRNEGRSSSESSKSEQSSSSDIQLEYLEGTNVQITQKMAENADDYRKGFKEKQPKKKKTKMMYRPASRTSNSPPNETPTKSVSTDKHATQDPESSGITSSRRKQTVNQKVPGINQHTDRKTVSAINQNGYESKSVTKPDKRKDQLQKNSVHKTNTSMTLRKRKRNLPKPSSSSSKMFNELSSRYQINLGCPVCFTTQKDFDDRHVLNVVSHTCTSKKRIFLKRKSGSYWVAIRRKHYQYQSGSGMCEFKENDQVCDKGTKCRYPHNSEELALWDQEACGKFDQGEFISDMQKSSLRLASVIRNFRTAQKGNFLLACRTCYNKQNQTISRKRLHVPECEQNHKWEDVLLFRKEGLKSEEDEYIACTAGKEQTEFGMRIATEVKNLLEIGFSKDNIVTESRKQSGNPVSETVTLFDSLERDLIDGSSDDESDSMSDEEFSGYLENIDDCDESSLYSSSEDELIIQDDDYPSYYTLDDSDDFDKLLQNYNRYKLCRIHLDSRDEATCTPVSSDDATSIKVRGRINCGPCFDGDEVIVEILQTPELDKETTVTRGKVVGLYRKMIKRKSYTFVCKVDSYQSNLMIPICGTVPKLHILDGPLRKGNYDKKLTNKVALFKSDRGDHIFTGKVRIDPKDTAKKLFVVKYIKWNSKYKFPLGYAVAAIPAGNNLSKARAVLSLKYQVPRSYAVKCLQQVQDSFQDQIPEKLVAGRMDLTDEFTFSVDPPDCQDIDDAFGVSNYSTNKYKVWVHISDVSAIVQEGDPVDQDAKRRMTSYYPGDNDPIHMLPPKLSTDLCSLKVGKRRLALSLCLIMDKAGNISTQPEFHQTIVKNDIAMSYPAAQAYICGKGEEAKGQDELAEKVRCLYSLAKSLRARRLSGSNLFCDMNSMEDDNCLEAHSMVEEFMLITNSKVAERLVEDYPECTPLVKQSMPIQDEFESFIEVNHSMLKIALYFQKFRELSQPINDGNAGCKSDVKLLLSTLKYIEKAFEKGDYRQIKQIIGMEEIHPDHAVAIARWYDIQLAAKCVCLGDDLEKSNVRHFSLQADVYTRFTSPIRRYMDIVVHRMLKASLKKLPCSYASRDITEMCCQANLVVRRAKRFSKDCDLIEIADTLQKHCLYLPAIVRGVDDAGLNILLPHTKRRHESITYRNLDLACKPDIAHNKDGVSLIWKRRLYDLRNLHPNARSKSQAFSMQKLDPGIHEVKYKMKTWSKILQAACANNLGQLEDCKSKLLNQLVSARFGTNGAKEITSEMRPPDQLIKHHCSFSIDWKIGSTLLVQVGSDCINGVMQPNINLLNLTPEVNLCLQHVKEPIRCFAGVATKCTKSTYRSLQDFQEIWLPILAMETAHCTVADGDPVVINNVKLLLKPRRDYYEGYFTLDKTLSKERFLNFGNEPKDEDGAELDEKSQDFMCIKYTLPTRDNPLCISERRNVWVGHAKSTSASLIGKESFIIEFQLHHYANEPPLELRDGQKCSVELIEKLLPNRRMEDAVRGLQDASDLCRNIALSKNLGELREPIAVPPADLNIRVKKGTTHRSLPESNPSQKLAIQHALSKPFTLIQGPPGTGKTMTAIKLAYWFDQMNKKQTDSGQRSQVLFCGPSNCAIDVATELLKECLGDQCPRIVRVYSKSVEIQLFPIPRDCVYAKSKTKGYKLSQKTERKDVDLHHLIRGQNNPFSEGIKRYDKLFKDNLKSPENVTNEQIEEYQKLVSKATKHELVQYDIILCTCEVAASPRIAKNEGLNVTQCIIDECGMCTEPQSLIPLVAFQTIKQVTLIGDHKQLSPIIHNSTAERLGLSKSLFERYAGMATMLNEQYRMHPAICEFPSVHFYDGELKSIPRWNIASKEMWHNMDRPIVFCHVEGAEKTLMVKTAEGNEQSKSNVAESQHAARIFGELHNKYNIPSENIAVLTQYKAQSSAITENLAEIFDNPTVNTVVASQGSEWDYVILSTVRSLPTYEIEKRPSIGWLKRNLGFITNEHQINVAITRAKKGLIILGNKHLLRCDKMWSALLDHYDEHGCLVDVKDFPRGVIKHRRAIRERQDYWNKVSLQEMRLERQREREMENWNRTRPPGGMISRPPSHDSDVATPRQQPYRNNMQDSRRRGNVQTF